MILNFGVIEIPYVHPPSTKRVKRRPLITKRGVIQARPTNAAGVPAPVTTGDVAQWLEDKYHIMEVFFEENQSFIFGQLENAMEGQMETLLMGGKINQPVAHSAFSEIEHRFRKFLSMQEMDGLGIPGVPTKAALMGISHRFKARHGPPRPSFIDTGLYQKAFRVWTN